MNGNVIVRRNLLKKATPRHVKCVKSVVTKPAKQQFWCRREENLTCICCKRCTERYVRNNITFEETLVLTIEDELILESLKRN